MNFLDVIRDLLPKGRAWSACGGCFRALLCGIGIEPGRIYEFFKQLLDDVFPCTSTQLDEWEDAFNLALTPCTATVGSRCQRLEAAWRARGGQSADYIQDVITSAGYNVTVTEKLCPPAAGGGVNYSSFQTTSYSVSNPQYGQFGKICDPAFLFNFIDPCAVYTSFTTSYVYGSIPYGCSEARVISNGVLYQNAAPEYLTQYGFDNYTSFGSSSQYGQLGDPGVSIIPEQIYPTTQYSPYYWCLDGDVPEICWEEFRTLILKIKPVHTHVVYDINFT